MTLRLHWHATDAFGRRWELNAFTPRARFIGRLLMAPDGSVNAGFLYQTDGVHRWSETVTESLRDGAVLLIAHAKRRALESPRR